MMFVVTVDDINSILRDYHINAACSSLTELQRCHYEEDDPASREVRLIVKAELKDDRSLVLRFKNEEDAPKDVIEAQSRFAALLYEHGIETPKAYVSDGLFARMYSISGYDVVVTVEDFKAGEIRTVDQQTARDTGELLAKMHNTAEANDFHVDCKVLFDPLAPNDLFFYESFVKRKERLLGIDSGLYHSIVKKHDELVSHIAPLGRETRYAVQGDISDCNLYRTEDGRIGVFDFNRCGDNSLFFDAIMQAVFESRLMDYPEELDGHHEEIVFSSFLEGYQQVRSFTAEQKEAFPYLYALITAFWGVDMKWADSNHTKTVDEADDVTVLQWMNNIFKREITMYTVPGLANFEESLTRFKAEYEPYTTASAMTIQELALKDLQPSQFYISEKKLHDIEAWLDPSNLSGFEPIPVKILDGTPVITDGHTRAAAALRAGLTAVPLVADEDDLDWEMYRACVKACRQRNIFSPADLLPRIISEQEYQEKWDHWCDNMQAEIRRSRITVKPYTEQELPDVLDFERRIREEEDCWGWEIDEQYIKNVSSSFQDHNFDNAISFLAYVDGIVAGRIDAVLLPSHFDGSVKAYLDWICVIKSYRHQGIAQALLAELKQHLKEKGITTLIALTASNDEAQRFYRSIPDSEMKDTGIWMNIE